MNKSRIALGLAGLAVGLSSINLAIKCNTKHYYSANIAKEKAVKYLSGEQYIKANNFISQQTGFDDNYARAVNYWDSLLIEAKTAEAYAKGCQMVRDSIEGKPYIKPNYDMNLDSILSSPEPSRISLIRKARINYAKVSDAQEYLKRLADEPYINPIDVDQSATQTHLWNMITLAGRQKEAFESGANTERDLYANYEGKNLDITE